MIITIKSLGIITIILVNIKNILYNNYMPNKPWIYGPFKSKFPVSKPIHFEPPKLISEISKVNDKTVPRWR